MTKVKIFKNNFSYLINMKYVSFLCNKICENLVQNFLIYY